MNRISAIIIARNEEATIRRAIKSLEGFPEILVLDSGSTDRTVEIAKSLGANVHRTDWPGYARQRERAVGMAANDWILFLDADEELDDEMKRMLAGVNLDGSCKGYYLRRSNYFVGKPISYSRWGNDWQLRLFNRKDAMITDVEIHEGVVVKGPSERIKEGFIKHHTARNLSTYLSKMNEYTSLEARQKANEGRSFSYLRLCWDPLSEFWKLYFVLQGWREGMRGLAIATLSALGRFLVMAKIMEIGNG